ncbi:hypothetical protein [Piscinibacter gummiphilus]|uniref:Uncharacterized protein n=1 Tax=Piscinibacter gummiphilus TaxID=946333 RepID=A0ABZ0CQX3_9BURK|nr:hypothetical protein [Piscinibacter gummiphilus]WOB06921.1 hypothetical protein RXV79_18585 [Piscinibacter gummiphilus]
MEDIRSLWEQIAPRITRDRPKVAEIQELLDVMFTSFSSGEKEAGRQAAIAIYNMKLEQLR